MFVLSKRNILIRSADGAEKVRLQRDGLQQVPDWAVKTPAFQRRLAAGEIVAVASTSDKDIQAAADKKPSKAKAKDGE